MPGQRKENILRSQACFLGMQGCRANRLTRAHCLSFWKHNFKISHHRHIETQSKIFHIIFKSRLLAHFPCVEKIKVGLWDHVLSICLRVCVSVFPPHQLLNVWTILYETWYVYHGTRTHLSGVLNRSREYVCIPLSLLLGNSSAKKKLQPQRIHKQQ
jgi:hypothetical protein